MKAKLLSIGNLIIDAWYLWVHLFYGVCFIAR
jgi:hypothetical protein